MTARPGLLIGLIQLVLAISWTAYAIYLPQLARVAGIAAALVPWILAVDQLVFALSDWASGVHADRVLARSRNLVPALLAVTLVSTLALALLPWAASTLGPVGLLALTVLWVATTAALRAPPMAMLVQFMPPAKRPMLAASAAFGIALAGAAAPYLAKQLRGLDPRWPLAMAAAGVMIAALGLLLAERRTTRTAPSPLDANDSGPRPLTVRSVAMLAVIAAFLALGFQAQVLLLPGQIGRVVPGEAIENFMPVFWGGFGVTAALGPFLFGRCNARPAMIIAAIAAAVGAATAAAGATVQVVAVGHAAAGLGWGVLLIGLFAVSITGATGQMAGRIAAIVFGALATAAFVRIASAAAGWPRSDVLGPGIAWSSSLAWLLGAVSVALFASNTSSRAGVVDAPAGLR